MFGRDPGKVLLWWVTRRIRTVDYDDKKCRPEERNQGLKSCCTPALLGVWRMQLLLASDRLQVQPTTRRVGVCVVVLPVYGAS